MERGDGEPGLADTDLSGLTRPTPSEVETVRSLKRRRWDFGFVGTSFRYGFLIIPSNTVYTTTMLLLHPLTLEPLYRTRRVLRHQPAQGEDQRGKGEVRPRLVGSRLRDAVKELCRLFSRVVESRRSRRGSH